MCTAHATTDHVDGIVLRGGGCWWFCRIVRTDKVDVIVQLNFNHVIVLTRLEATVTQSQSDNWQLTVRSDHCDLYTRSSLLSHSRPIGIRQRCVDVCIIVWDALFHIHWHWHTLHRPHNAAGPNGQERRLSLKDRSVVITLSGYQGTRCFLQGGNKNLKSLFWLFEI